MHYCPVFASMRVQTNEGSGQRFVRKMGEEENLWLHHCPEGAARLAKKMALGATGD
jgi:hypothetical protein